MIIGGKERQHCCLGLRCASACTPMARGRLVQSQLLPQDASAVTVARVEHAERQLGRGSRCVPAAASTAISRVHFRIAALPQDCERLGTPNRTRGLRPRGHMRRPHHRVVMNRQEEEGGCGYAAGGCAEKGVGGDSRESRVCRALVRPPPSAALAQGAHPGATLGRVGRTAAIAAACRGCPAEQPHLPHPGTFGDFALGS